MYACLLHVARLPPYVSVSFSATIILNVLLKFVFPCFTGKPAAVEVRDTMIHTGADNNKDVYFKFITIKKECKIERICVQTLSCNFLSV